MHIHIYVYVCMYVYVYIYMYSDRYSRSRVQTNPTALQFILKYALNGIMFHADGVFRMQLNDHAPSIRMAWPSTSSPVSTLQCTSCEGVLVLDCVVFIAYHLVLRRRQAIHVDCQPSRNECNCKDQAYIHNGECCGVTSCINCGCVMIEMFSIDPFARSLFGICENRRKPPCVKMVWIVLLLLCARVNMLKS